MASVVIAAVATIATAGWLVFSLRWQPQSRMRAWLRLLAPGLAFVGSSFWLQQVWERDDNADAALQLAIAGVVIYAVFKVGAVRRSMVTGLDRTDGTDESPAP